ncbi:MAG: NAD(P)-dependent oxidoreductase [Lentisphaerae bacterium]|nr:NAD(P)-dependent oxidoreductase [Lentisphaerota bacterium]
MNSDINYSIGFIGTGVMGASMAGHLLNAGKNLTVFNRTRSKSDKLIENGATWSNSPEELAIKNDLIITMLGYPADVESIYFGENGLIANARPGSFLVDMTTSSPVLAKKIYAAALAKGLFALDAPVSGGDIGARNATLIIMTGGEREVFEKLLPVLKIFGERVHYHGVAGSGQHTKMCNQIAIAGGMLGVCEALAYARKSGLDPQKVLESISHGAAGSWSLSNLAPRILNDDFSPGFFVKHFIKDMRIALESAQEMELDLPGLKLAHELYEQLAQQGYEDSGTQALFKLYTNGF